MLSQIPYPDKKYQFTPTYLRPGSYYRRPAASVHPGGGGGILTRSPSHILGSSVISVLSTPFNVAASTTTTSSAVPGGMSLCVIPVVSVITVPIPILLSYIVSLSDVSVEILLPWWFKGGPAISDESDEIPMYLSPQRHMLARALPDTFSLGVII